MGKTPKVKKREVSLHSRAARRNASPPPKDLTVKGKLSPKETEHQPWLHNAQNAGITKKKKKNKVLTRQQKVRQQQGLEKADVIAGKLEKKVADSRTRAKKVDARRKGWDELNGMMGGGEKKGKSHAPLKQDGEEKMEDVVLADVEQPVPVQTAELEQHVAEGKAMAAPPPPPLPLGSAEEIDEVL